MCDKKSKQGVYEKFLKEMLIYQSILSFHRRTNFCVIWILYTFHLDISYYHCCSFQNPLRRQYILLIIDERFLSNENIAAGNSSYIIQLFIKETLKNHYFVKFLESLGFFLASSLFWRRINIIIPNYKHKSQIWKSWPPMDSKIKLLNLSSPSKLCLNGLQAVLRLWDFKSSTSFRNDVAIRCLEELNLLLYLNLKFDLQTKFTKREKTC